MDKKVKKRARLSIGSLKKRLDTELSHFVRWSRCDDGGYLSCVTCKKTQHWKEMQAGHYISRKVTAVRWNEQNVFPQCKRCNGPLKGNMDEYALYLDETLGIEHRSKLNSLKYRTTVQVNRKWLEEQITHYKLLNLKFKHLL